MFGKVGRDYWFFFPGCIHYFSMNQSLFLLFHYLRQGNLRLFGSCYFKLDGHKKCRCFIRKLWRNSIFLRKSNLNSLSLVVTTSICCRVCFMIFIWSETNWNGVMVFLNFFNLVELSQSMKLFNWEWFNLVFYLLILLT